jgi:quercetin dioxygenase-like cupin family protein
MTVRVASATERVARVIENPLSGERIVIHQLPPDRRSRLSWELYLAPGGRVPSSHVHPGQEEVFRVVSGRVRFRLGAQRIVAGPGDTVRVPARTVHHFANASPEEAHISVETEPALDIVGMFEVAASLAQDQYARGRTFPHPFDLALFMRDFDAEVQAPYLPAWLVRAFVRPLAWSVRKLGWDARYRRWRESPGRGDGAALRAFS